MSTEQPFRFGFDPAGNFLICGDGPELLVHRRNGAPAYKLFLDGLIAGISVFLDQLFVVDTEGTLRIFRLGDGELLGEAVIGRSASELSVDFMSGKGLVTSVEGPILFEGVGTQPRMVSVPGTTACALGPGGESAGVGTGGGAFSALDLGSGTAWGTVELQQCIKGVAWSNAGFWVVSCGEQLHLVSGDGQSLLCSLQAQGEVGPVAVSSDGLVAAVVENNTCVAIFDLYGKKPAGRLVTRRTIVGVEFGPHFVLGFGMEDGDAMRVDLLSGQSNRTEPHPGRSRNTYRMTNEVDDGALRGALAFHQVAGGPIAEYIAPPDPEGEEGNGCLWGCTGTVLLSWILLITVGMCAGLGYMGRYSFGWW